MIQDDTSTSVKIQGMIPFHGDQFIFTGSLRDFEPEGYGIFTLNPQAGVNWKEDFYFSIIDKEGTAVVEGNWNKGLLIVKDKTGEVNRKNICVKIWKNEKIKDDYTARTVTNK